MIFRQKGSPDSHGQYDMETLKQAVAKLPKQEPRPGLKQEMLANILAEVHAEGLAPARPQNKFALRLPALRFSLSLVGGVLAVALLITMLPDARKIPDGMAQNHKTSRYVTGTQQTDGQLSMLESEREKKLLQQLMPHHDGTFVGEGVEINVDDKQAKLIRKGVLNDNVEANLDLYTLVQEIYENGGSIVSINGIMVEPYTEIVTRGALTRIQDRRINTPFTIKVIGDGTALYAKLSDPQSVLNRLKEDKGMDVVLQREDNIQIGLPDAE
ncbi:MAG: DUF881 domain-containing protein [Tumebacillaceae bacterium]